MAVNNPTKRPKSILFCPPNIRTHHHTLLSCLEGFSINFFLLVFASFSLLFFFCHYLLCAPIDGGSCWFISLTLAFALRKGLSTTMIRATCHQTQFQIKFHTEKISTSRNREKLSVVAATTVVLWSMQTTEVATSRWTILSTTMRLLASMNLN